MKFKESGPNLGSEESYEKQEVVVLDDTILTSLDKKHFEYFKAHNKKMRERFGDLFNADLNTKRVVEKYFKDLSLTPELLQEKTALYLGSANSMFDEYCEKKYGTNFTSIDIDEENLGKDHPQGVVTDARQLPFKDEVFDLVISEASMPHVLIPNTDNDGNFIQIEGAVKEVAYNDVLSVFREAYRVLKPGGQIRMSTFSAKEEWEHIGNRVRNNIQPFIADSSYQQFKRINLVKEVMKIFEEETGANCTFTTSNRGGLIIITKNKYSVNEGSSKDF